MPPMLRDHKDLAMVIAIMPERADKHKTYWGMSQECRDSLYRSQPLPPKEPQLCNSPTEFADAIHILVITTA